MSVLLDGKALALQRENVLRGRVEKWASRTGRSAKLATILVGDDPASATYVKMKGNACLRVGIAPLLVKLDASIDTSELIRQIQILNFNPDVFGILLQHPVPAHIDERACFDEISLAKDTDGVSSAGFGRLAMGLDAFGSATPSGIMALLKAYNINPAGVNAVVIGRSPILGKPMAAMLLNANATVTVCHSQTQNLQKIVERAQLVVAAVGRPGFVPGEWIADDAVVIDAGYHPGGIGDVAFGANTSRWKAYTPVPGGVGPMTISALLENTVVAMERESSLQV